MEDYLEEYFRHGLTLKGESRSRCSMGRHDRSQTGWIYENHDKLNVPFIAAIGAVFDFYAGTRKRSSGFWITIGLEWLPRFLKAPRRLWERNLKSTPIFLGWVLKEKIKQMMHHRGNQTFF